MPTLPGFRRVYARPLVSLFPFVLMLLSLVLPAGAAAQTCPSWQSVAAPVPPGATATYPRAVHAAAPDDVWVVGEYTADGHIRAFSMHWNGATWTFHPVTHREDGLGIDQIVLSAVKYISVSPGALKNDATVLAR